MLQRLEHCLLYQARDIGSLALDIYPLKRTVPAEAGYNTVHGSFIKPSRQR